MGRESWFLGAAVLLHAAVPALAAVAPPAPIHALATETLVPIEVEPMRPLPRELETPREVPRPEAPSDQDTVRSPLPVARNTTRTDPGAQTPDTNVPIAPTAEPSSGAPKDQYTPLDDRGVVRALPGIGNPVWALPGVVPQAPRAAAAPTAAPDMPAPTGGRTALNDAIKAKDKSLGLDLPAAGTVASAVREIVKSSDTPNSSRATFEVRLGPKGNVLGVRVVSSNGGTADVWERAAQSAAAQLKGKTLAMSSDLDKGAFVYVDVVSDLAIPSGGGSSVSMQGSGIGFDVADIGAHKQRVVKSSFRVVPIH